MTYINLFNPTRSKRDLIKSLKWGIGEKNNFKNLILSINLKINLILARFIIIYTAWIF